MRWFSGVALAGAFLIGAGVAHASAEGIEGSWSGGGYVKPRDGQAEKVSCRVSFRRQTPTVYSVSAKCASKSATINQTGQLLKVGSNRYVGDFHNPEFDISGRVRVVVSGSSQTVTFSSPSGGGSLSLRRR